MKPHARKKLATLCGLIGASISCIGVGQAENSAGPVTDAASRLAPEIMPATHPEKLTKPLPIACALPVLTEAMAISNEVVVYDGDSTDQLRNTSSALLPVDGTDLLGEMPPPLYDDDPLGEFLLALQERETVPPTLPQDDVRRSGDTILLKQETEGRRPAELTAEPPLGLMELPVADSELQLVMSDTLAVIEDGTPPPDYSVGNQWFVSIDLAESPATDSASMDNAADAISATLEALAERRSYLDTHDASGPSIALESGAALRTADREPIVDLAQSENSVVPPERAIEAKQNGSVQSPLNEWLAVSNNSLDGMRGGFDTGRGLIVSFGIERAVYINGNLTTSTSFNIPDVSKLAADQAKITANQVRIAAEQAKVTAEQARVTASQTRLAAEQAKVAARQVGVAASPAAASPVPAVASPVPAVALPVAVTQAGLSEQARIASEQAMINSEQARLTDAQAKINSEQASLNSEQSKINSVPGATVTLVQNGPGNTFQPGLLPQAVAATVIQNTLDNQSIKSLTVINTSVNSLSVLKVLNAQASLRDALGNSLGIR